MNRTFILTFVTAACLVCAPAALVAQQQAPAKAGSSMQMTKSADKGDTGMHMTSAPPASGPVTPVNKRMICMITNKAYSKPQLPVTVKGRTYYGCCDMCRHTLKTDASSRYATDPISGKKVDKSKAVVGKDAKGSVVYFQNQADFDAYNARQAKHPTSSGL